MKVVYGNLTLGKLCSSFSSPWVFFLPQWQSSTDEYGRTYFYQINGTLTAWELPEVCGH